MRFYVTTRGVFRSATLVRSLMTTATYLGKHWASTMDSTISPQLFGSVCERWPQYFDRTLPSVLSEGFYGELVTSFFKLPISVVIASSKFLRAVASRVATFAL